MGILLVYDVCDERSFNSMGLWGADVDIRTWFQNVEQHATEGVHKILIGNKCDWTEKRVVSEDQGRALAQELGIPFIETSAKSNINVEEAFFSLARYPSNPYNHHLPPISSKYIPYSANSSDIKKKLIDSAATTSGAGTNVNLDNKGQGKLGGGCCS
jgi:Ras-related protein Rab-8A